MRVKTVILKDGIIVKRGLTLNINRNRKFQVIGKGVKISNLLFSEVQNAIDSIRNESNILLSK